MKTNDKKIKLNKDNCEIYCDKCNGTGEFPNLNEKDKVPTIEDIKNNVLKFQNFYIQETCTKCNGTGKLDWLEYIFGNNDSKLDYYWAKEAINILSKQLAADIDSEIMKQYSSNFYKSYMGKWEA